MLFAHLPSGSHRAAARSKVRNTILVFGVLTTFTLNCRRCKALATALHKQNFRRLVRNRGWWKAPQVRHRPRGRPAELFRFRREGGAPCPGCGWPPGAALKSKMLRRSVTSVQHKSDLRVFDS